LQVTVPKPIADQYGIRPGDKISRVPAGTAAKLRLFDEATARFAGYAAGRETPKVADRGWKKEDLYERGRSR